MINKILFLLLFIVSVTACQTEKNSTTSTDDIKKESPIITQEMSKKDMSEKDMMEKEEMIEKDMSDKDMSEKEEMIEKKKMADKAESNSIKVNTPKKTKQNVPVPSTSTSNKVVEAKENIKPVATTPARPKINEAPKVVATNNTPTPPPPAPPAPPTKAKVAETAPSPAVLKPDHTAWDQLTKKFVSNTGKVNYSGFKGQLSTIETYLTQLENTPPTSSWSKNEKLAYWFNLYNAATVHMVASNYPIKSIRDLEGGKPWDKKFVS